MSDYVKYINVERWYQEGFGKSQATVIQWPTGEALKSVLNGFAEEWKFPQCAGVIDGTHIKIAAPSDYPLNYYNRKCFHSIIMQAVVDHAYR